MQNFVLPKLATYCILILQVVQFYCFLSATANCVNLFKDFFYILDIICHSTGGIHLAGHPKRKEKRHGFQGSL